VFPLDTHHSTLFSLFARASNLGEWCQPYLFRCLQLITNSNFVACCTGKSAGLRLAEAYPHTPRRASKLLLVGALAHQAVAQEAADRK
jgi:hypothetical protein